MSRILRVSQSDYRIKVKDEGTITLDTGVDVGLVVITGDLEVRGETTTVNTTNLDIEDNIIFLNKGESPSHAGVTEDVSGLEIDRGSLDNAQFVWDENRGTDGMFAVQTITTSGTATLSPIAASEYTAEVSENIKFNLEDPATPGAWSGAFLELTNTDATSYSNALEADTLLPTPLGDNWIPNRKFVTDYVLAYDGLAVVDKIFYPVSQPTDPDTQIQAFETSLRFSIKSGGTLNQRAQITSAGLDVDDIRISNDTVQTTGTENLILTALNKNVDVDAVLNLTDQPDPAGPTGGRTLIYSKSAVTTTPGDSGIYFTNNVSTDELVAKNRALLFSMLF